MINEKNKPIFEVNEYDMKDLADVFKIVPFALFLPINGVFALSEVDCGFKQRLPQTKDLKKCYLFLLC
jgi:hypothetical protein